MKRNRLLGLLLVASLPVGGSAFAQYNLPPGTQLPDTPRSAQAAASRLEEAEDKIAQGDFAAAKPILEAYLHAHPADARALYDLGYANQASGSDLEAVSNYRKAIAADPKQFESRLALGLLLARRGKQAEARRQIVSATSLIPSPPDPAAQAQAFRALAALDKESDPAAARSALLSALRLSPETPQDLLLTAQIAEASGDDSTAEESYQDLIAKHPPGGLAAQAAGGLAHLLMKQGKYPEAESILRAALAGGSVDSPASISESRSVPTTGSASLQAQLATALIAQDKNKEALPALETLERMEPNNSSVQRMLADAYSQAGYPEKAAPFYAALAKLQPEDSGLLAAMGKNLIEQKDYEQAQQVLARVVQLKPDDGESWSGLAYAAFQNKRYSIALQALSMRAKYLPETPASYFLRAASYDSLQESKPARLYYRKFLAADKGKLSDQEWQARQRLKILDRER